MSGQDNHGENTSEGNSENPMVLSDPARISDVQCNFDQDEYAMLREQHRAEMVATKQELRMKDEEVAKLKQEIDAERVEKEALEEKLKQAELRVSGLEQCNMAYKMRISELESAVKDKDQKLERSALWTDELESRIQRSDLEVSELKKTIKDKEDIVEIQKVVFDERVRLFNSELKKCQDQVKNLTEEIKLLQEEKVAQEAGFQVEKKALKDKFMIKLNEKDMLFRLAANTQLADREKLKERLSEMKRTMEEQMEKLMMVQFENDALQRELDMTKSSEKLARAEEEEKREKVVDLMAKIARITGQKEGENLATRAPSPPPLHNTADEAHGEPTLSAEQDEVPSKKRKME